MPSSIQENLALLRHCEEAPHTPEQLDLLRAALKHRGNLVVERAAQIANDHKWESLQAELQETLLIAIALLQQPQGSTF